MIGADDTRSNHPLYFLQTLQKTGLIYQSYLFARQLFFNSWEGGRSEPVAMTIHLLRLF